MYVYIYVYVYICICIYIHMYIYSYDNYSKIISKFKMQHSHFLYLLVIYRNEHFFCMKNLFRNSESKASPTI